MKRKILNHEDDISKYFVYIIHVDAHDFESHTSDLEEIS